jgi:dTDP-4-amino-4,6-dideoxygalactose transaminase
MTDVEAALALCQLDRLQRTVSRREELARRYSGAFAPLAEEGVCILPADIPGRVWYRYVVRVDDPDRVIQHLADLGVVAARPVENWGGATAATPAALAAYGHLVSLPLYPALTSAQQEVVISAFVSALAAAPPL